MAQENRATEIVESLQAETNGLVELVDDTDTTVEINITASARDNARIFRRISRMERVTLSAVIPTVAQNVAIFLSVETNE